MRLQMASAFCIASCGLVMVFTLSEPSYRYTSAVLVLALVPRMVGIIPSLANVAAENFGNNVPGALVGTFVNLAIVVLSIKCGWGLLGVAIGLFASSSIELCIKLMMTLPWIQALAPPAQLPNEVKHRMFCFSAQSVILMVIEYVIWDRSDVFFLRLLDRDIRQITFFSLALNLTDKVLMIPGTLGGAIGVSVMAEYARDRIKLKNMVSKAAVYMLVISLPLLVGFASLSRPIVQTLYGQQYSPAVAVLAVAALFAIPKALLHPVQELLQAAEDQKFVIAWSCVCAVVNVALDFLLVSRFGALGAAMANGGAQTMAVLGIWLRATRLLDLPVRQKLFLKIFASGGAMAAVVTTISLTLRPWLALCIGTLGGAVIYCAVLRFTAVLTPDDRHRLLGLGRSVPQPLRIHVDRLVNVLVPVQKEPS